MAALTFQFDPNKTREALAYLTSKSPNGRSKYILGKLLFLADKYHLVRYGRPITGDRYFAMKDGPAPNKVLDHLNMLIDDPESIPSLSSFFRVDRSFRYPRIILEKPTGFDNLSQSDIEALDEILARHGSKDFPELRALTHETVAYQNAWGGRKKNAAPMDFADFFEEDADAFDGVLEEAIEDSNLRAACQKR
jgi:antitoxin SocA-like protein